MNFLPNYLNPLDPISGIELMQKPPGLQPLFNMPPLTTGIVQATSIAGLYFYDISPLGQLSSLPKV